jgi:biotin-dependent carboxylase-like uncharacterized protein
MRIKIHASGMQSILVDAGRRGHQHEGFCEAGPMDEDAYWWGNYLVANQESSPCIEVIGELSLMCDDAGIIAATGREVQLKINHKEAEAYQTQWVKEGDEITLSSNTMGSKTYLFIGGNWQVPTVLGSACTVVREQLGGLANDGQVLTSGDEIRIVPSDSSITPTKPRRLAQRHWPKYDFQTPLKVIEGYQSDCFSAVARRTFFSSEYQITSNVNRMGFRLKGRPVGCEQKSMLSEAIHIGAIQIPSDGQPIVMMRDRQTLGGYPKLGCVDPIDVSRLAQAVPGESVAFTPIHSDNARARFLLHWQQRRRITGEVT